MSEINKFWQNWKYKTKTEQELINQLEKTIPILIKYQNQIKSIYIKGTFPRRDTIPKSDIDIILIYKENNYDENKQKIKNELKKQNLDKISISQVSIQELKKGKKHDGKNATRISKHINQYELLTGDKLKQKELKTRTNKEDLKKLIKAFKTIFLPKYENKEMTFYEIIKQTYWLADNELRYKKITPKNTWQEIINQIQKLNEEHIIKKSYYYRKQIAQNKKITTATKQKHIQKIKQHIQELENIIK